MVCGRGGMNLLCNLISTRLTCANENGRSRFATARMNSDATVQISNCLPPRSHRPLALTLFGVLSLVQLLFLEGHINTPDGQVMFHVNRAILERGSLAIDPLPGYRFGGLYVEDQGGKRLYSKFGLGTTLVSLPSMVLGKVLAPLASEAEQGIFEDYRHRIDEINAARHPTVPYAREFWYNSSRHNFHEAFLAYFATWANPIVVAGIGAMLFLLGLQFGFGLGPSLLLAVASNFMTPLWHYAGEFFAEPLSALSSLVFLWCCRESLQSRRVRGRLVFLGGLGLGMAVLAKTANAVLLPWGALYGIWTARAHRLAPRSISRWLMCLGTGVAAVLLVSAWYNFVRFGSVLETGYGNEAGQFNCPFLAGLYGLSFSPGRGILWHHPLILPGLAGGLYFWRKWRAETVFIYGVSATYLAMYSKWHSWEGGWCWGPRFLVGVIPLMLLPAVPVAMAGWRKGGIFRLLMGGLALFLLMVAYSGVSINYNVFICWLRDLFDHGRGYFLARWGYTSYYDLMRWRWEYSPIAHAFAFPIRQQPILLAAFRYPGIILGINLAMVGLLVGLLARLRRLVIDFDR